MRNLTLLTTWSRAFPIYANFVLLPQFKKLKNPFGQIGPVKFDGDVGFFLELEFFRRSDWSKINCIRHVQFRSENDQRVLLGRTNLF